MFIISGGTDRVMVAGKFYLLVPASPNKMDSARYKDNIQNVTAVPLTGLRSNGMPFHRCGAETLVKAAFMPLIVNVAI